MATIRALTRGAFATVSFHYVKALSMVEKSAVAFAESSKIKSKIESAGHESAPCPLTPLWQHFLVVGLNRRYDGLHVGHGLGTKGQVTGTKGNTYGTEVPKQITSNGSANGAGKFCRC